MGGISLIIGDSKGGLAQWFMARDPDGEQRFKQIRTFQMGTAPIVEITAEERRKGFIALDASGKLGVFHSTAHRTLLVDPVVEGQGVFGLSPRANRVIVEAGGKLQPLLLDNPHPEVSWSALWSKVWYENYDEPKYVWQSTAANTDFRTQAEPGAADLRYLEGRVLRHAAGRTAGRCRCDLHRLLHGPGPAPQGQAGDRTDGSDADGDPRFLRRPVPGAVCRRALCRASSAC